MSFFVSAFQIRDKSSINLSNLDLLFDSNTIIHDNHNFTPYNIIVNNDIDPVFHDPVTLTFPDDLVSVTQMCITRLH